MAETFTFTVNGKPTTVTTERDRSLLEVIREDLQLTGTHYRPSPLAPIRRRRVSRRLLALRLHGPR